MTEELDLDLGIAGGSSRREYERRRAKREEQTQERHLHIGNLLLKFQEAPASAASLGTTVSSWDNPPMRAFSAGA